MSSGNGSKPGNCRANRELGVLNIIGRINLLMHGCVDERKRIRMTLEVLVEELGRW